MTKKFTAVVEIEVTVTVDETKFDEAFMAEFRESFYQFDDLRDHIKHLAQLEARGLSREDFIEGYGPPSDMGIKLEIDDWGVSQVYEASPSSSPTE